MAPLLPRFIVRAEAGFAAGLLGAVLWAVVGLSGFLFFSKALGAGGLAALALPGFAVAPFEAFGAVLRRSDFVAMQPPDTRGGI
jgi:hypothetical protein